MFLFRILVQTHSYFVLSETDFCLCCVQSKSPSGGRHVAVNPVQLIYFFYRTRTKQIVPSLVCTGVKCCIEKESNYVYLHNIALHSVYKHLT
jgi:hypothetical protein